MSESPPAASVSLPGYDVTVVIGGGNFGEVYAATETGISGRPLAVKILRATLRSESELIRFERERDRLLGGLTGNPFIADVVEVAIGPQGRPFIVMPLYRNGSLAQEVGTWGPLQLERVVPMVLRISSALDSAHHRGVIHRDVAPGNILLTEQDTPILADFGVAAIMDSTDSGDPHVPARHAAPEVVGGGRFTVASDVYSLASTTYFLLTGQEPFPGAGAAGAGAAGAGAAGPRPRPADIGREDVPPGVYAAIATALAVDPGERFVSAGDFARELALAAGMDTNTTGTGPVERKGQPEAAAEPAAAPPKKSGGRSRLLVAGGAVVTLAVVAIAGAAVWSHGQYRVSAVDDVVAVRQGVGLPLLTRYTKTTLALADLPTDDRAAVRQGIATDGRAGADARIKALRADVAACAGTTENGCPAGDLVPPSIGVIVGTYPKANELTVSWGDIVDRRAGVLTELLIDGRPAPTPCPPKLDRPGTCTVTTSFGARHVASIRVTAADGTAGTRDSASVTPQEPAVEVGPGPKFADGSTQYCAVVVDVRGLHPDKDYALTVTYRGAPADRIDFTADASGNYQMGGRGYGYTNPAANAWVQVDVAGVKLTDRHSPWVC